MRSRVKPHSTPSAQVTNIIGFCASCDVKVEQDLPLRLPDYCDCDQYKRWICLCCKLKEDRANGEYFMTRTKYVSNEYDNDDMKEVLSGLWVNEPYDYIGVSPDIRIFRSVIRRLYC